MNNITLMGRICAEPELKLTQNQIAVTSFNLAVDRDYTPKGQEKQTDFITVVAWRSTAEFITKYFHKGSLIALQGAVQTRQYQDKQGNKRTAFEVVADKVFFTGEKQDNQYKPEVNAPNAIDRELTRERL